METLIAVALLLMNLYVIALCAEVLRLYGNMGVRPVMRGLIFVLVCMAVGLVWNLASRTLC